MTKIALIHRDRPIGELEVMDHIRLPFEKDLQTILDLSLRSRTLLYKPAFGDITLEERDGKLVGIVSDKLGSGDVALMVGFSSEDPQYQRDTEMDDLLKQLAPDSGEQSVMGQNAFGELFLRGFGNRPGTSEFGKRDTRLYTDTVFKGK